MRAFTKYLRKSSGEVGILEALEGGSLEKVIRESHLRAYTLVLDSRLNINNTS